MRSLFIALVLFMSLEGCSPALPPKSNTSSATSDSAGLLKSHREEAERCRVYAERAIKEREKAEAYLLQANEILAEVRRVEDAGLHAQKACKARRVREAKAVKEVVVKKEPPRDLVKEARMQREREALLREYSPSDAPPGIYEKLQGATMSPKPKTELTTEPTTELNVGQSAGSNVATPAVAPSESHSEPVSEPKSEHK